MHNFGIEFLDVRVETAQNRQKKGRNSITLQQELPLSTMYEESKHQAVKPEKKSAHPQTVDPG